MPERSPADSRGPSHARAAILDAFVALALQRRYDVIRIADLVAGAGVSRSTFYEHFRGKDAVLLEAMQPLLLALATAASGRAARSYVQDMVRHIWEQRSIARPLLRSAAASIVQRRLADAIRPHLERNGWSADASYITATGIAAAQLAMLRCWLSGEATATVADISDRLIACSRLLVSEQR